MGFRVIDHTADIGIEAEGASLGALFAEVARGFVDVVTDLDGIEPSGTRTVRVEAGSLEMLLVDWLSELLYLFETEGLLFSTVDAELSRFDDGWRLAAVCRGERFDADRHELKVPLKAVTYHGLEVAELPGGRWRARVIFDI